MDDPRGRGTRKHPPIDVCAATGHTLTMFNTHTTGNLWFVLPRISAPPAGVDRLAFLMMRHRGLIELLAPDERPWLAADVRAEGRSLLAGAVGHYDHDWIPTYEATADAHHATLTWLTPDDHRGMVGRLRVENRGDAPLQLTLRFELTWGRTLVTTYDSEPLEGRFGLHPWGCGAGPALEWVTDRTAFALGIGRPEGAELHLALLHPQSNAVVWEGDPSTGERRRFERGLTAVVTATRAMTLAPRESAELDLYLSVSQDAQSASFDTRVLRQRGCERLLADTRQRLATLNQGLPESLATDPQLGPLVRRNRLFCYYYSLGRTLDTEEICPVTSRSSDYYVSAGYWDRDSLLWTFPTVLDMDRAMAEEMLRVAFGRQGRNIGVHSRFIDGTIYEQGFELDELCAPLIALDRYIRTTEDWGILDRLPLNGCVTRVAHALQARCHPQHPLVSTEYLPTDDQAEYPYCIYDNVLVWVVAGVLERIALNRDWRTSAKQWAAYRDEIGQALRQHGVVTVDGQKMFAWSTDLAGNHRLYDEPPGSLLLLAWYGYCKADDPVFDATVRWIYSPRNEHYFAQMDEIGCRHEPHPWVLAVANSLLVPQRRDAALALLRRVTMDQGLACEAIDENTGAVASGRHFATCAGFLCNALVEAMRG